VRAIGRQSSASGGNLALEVGSMKTSKWPPTLIISPCSLSFAVAKFSFWIFHCHFALSTSTFVLPPCPPRHPWLIFYQRKADVFIVYFTRVRYNTNCHRHGRYIAENRTYSYQQIHAHEALFVKIGKVLNLGRLDFDIVYDFEFRISCFSYRDTLHDSRFTKLPSTIVENPLQIGPIFCKTNPIC
jgi:hypothetical protein